MRGIGVYSIYLRTMQFTSSYLPMFSIDVCMETILLVLTLWPDICWLRFHDWGFEQSIPTYNCSQWEYVERGTAAKNRCRWTTKVWTRVVYMFSSLHQLRSWEENKCYVKLNNSQNENSFHSMWQFYSYRTILNVILCICSALHNNIF